MAEIQTRLLLHPSSSSSKLLDQTQIQANELNQTGHEREGRPRGLIRRLRTRFGWEISDEGGQEART